MRQYPIKAPAVPINKNNWPADAVTPVRLILGTLKRPEFELAPIIKELSREFGMPDLKSEPADFHFSAYYEKEMGRSLLRQFFAFPKLIDRRTLTELKLTAMEIEGRFKDDSGRRPLNLDPGFVTLHQVVLASTKMQKHRLYMERGIWADVHLVYHTGAFHTLQWTYPDYAEKKQLAWLAQVRDLLKRELREEQCHEV